MIAKQMRIMPETQDKLTFDFSANFLPINNPIHIKMEFSINENSTTSFKLIEPKALANPKTTASMESATPRYNISFILIFSIFIKSLFI